MAVVFIIATAGTIIVIVVLVLRNRRGDYSKKYCDLLCNLCCIIVLAFSSTDMQRGQWRLQPVLWMQHTCTGIIIIILCV